MRHCAIAAAMATVLLLAACGGGGGGGGGAPTTTPPEQPAPPPASIAFPLTSGSIARAGIDQGATHLRRLPEIGERGDVEIRYGRLDDGIGQNELQNALIWQRREPVTRFTSAPELRVIGPAKARERGMVAAAVRAINLSLPPEYRIRLRRHLPDLSLRNTIGPDGRYYEGDDELDNTIHVQFLPCQSYHHGCGTVGGTTWTIDEDQEIDHAYIQIARGIADFSDARSMRILIAHEVLHALGLHHVTWGREPSIMRHRGGILVQGPASILHPLDREMLSVFYRRVEPGGDLAQFGPWSAQSTHLAGNGLHANFGVALRNGYAEAWAHGPRPRTALEDNPELAGTVTWRGALVGFSRRRPVMGDARIAVDLAGLDGRASFTALESWAAGARPGAAGSGAQWGDGDLGYAIEVRGNTFRRTGGDEGELAGIFTGAAHEGAAGTLERSDLTAAFGASR